MSETIKIFLLAVIQGITEIFPISSSGHLVLFKHIFGLNIEGMGLEVVLHFGTFLAVLVYFRKRILDLVDALLGKNPREKSTIAYIIVGTIPAGLLGYLTKKKIELFFSSPEITSMLLIINGLFLLFVSTLRESSSRLNWLRSLIIGMFQSIAILPGISRSGFTVGGARILGLRGEDAFEFSFLLAIPVMLGAFALELKETLPMMNPIIVIATAISFIFGLLSISIFANSVRKGKLSIFGIYSIIIGFLSIIRLIF